MTKAAELAKMGEVLTNSQIGGRRNILINGGLQISQRGTDLNDVSHGDYCADRFQITKANTDQLVINYDQSTDTPDGFSNSFKLSVGTVESAIDTNEYLMINQKIEAQNLQHLKYGTSSAETLTLSFHVKSSVTGTYAISVFQQDASKYYSTTYTVNSANTWEYKTVKINGNTSDIINNDNGSGLRLSWTLSSGSNFTSGSNDAWGASSNWAVGHNASWITTSSATFFLTGVQLEVGSQATPFEHRSFGEELFLCSRYCRTYTGQNFGRARDGDSYYGGGLHFNPPMRSTPTLKSGATFTTNTGNAGTPGINSGLSPSADGVQIYNSGSSWTTNAFVRLTATFEAEL